MNDSALLTVSLDKQTLDLSIGGNHVRSYVISSGEKGMGFTEGSFRTPTGSFEICEKIGEDLPLFTRFDARVPVGEWKEGEITEDDLILTRILRLEGLDPTNANTKDRYIYIHGTNREDLLGEPTSHGCIRLGNGDMVDLFDRVKVGSKVEIAPLSIQKGKLLFLDCDSTLSSIEGIDELARLSDPATFAEVEALTNAAMDGKVPLSEVFKRRMEIIRPDLTMANRVATIYLENLLPGVGEAVIKAKSDGWLPVILSGGFAPLIAPLAKHLGIRHIEAVPLSFGESGEYAGYGESYPTTRNLGKNEIIREWKEAMLPERVVMIGDGISDLETKGDVDKMIGFGGVVEREKVKEGCDLWMKSFDDVDSFLEAINS